MTRPASTARIVTADEFLTLDLPEGKAELVRGEVRMTPYAGGPHGRVGTTLTIRLGVYAEPRGLGWAFADGTSFELVRLPHAVRCPDVSFVRAERLPPGGIGPGFLKFAPDLAVEILSPTERAADLQEKLDDYRAAGTLLIWVIDPRRRTVRILDGDSPERTLREGDVLDGGTIIPGFSCPVADLFNGIARDS
jgi:Uma2 family endonuclease